MIVTVVYNSSDSQSLLSAYMCLSLYPAATLLDTAGLDTAAITALIGTVSATSQNRIYVLVDVGTNPPSGNLVAAQITALTGKLSTAPGSDTAPIEIAASSGTLNSQVLRPTLTWNSLYPVNTPAYASVIMSRQNFWTELGTSTATAGASTSITDSAVQFAPDQLVSLWVEITDGTGVGQIRRILTNSATVITIDGTWATTPDNTSVYRVRAYQLNESLVYSGETATSGAVGAINNTGAAYTVDALIGYTVRITAGTGSGQEVLIADNTATSIVPAIDFTVAPDNTSVYEIVSYDYRNSNETILVESERVLSAGANTIVASGTDWSTNGYQGFLVRVTGGTGAGQIRYIASNNATTLTVSQAWAVNPDSTSQFDIYKEGGSWTYELADFYLDLAMALHSTVSSSNVQIFNSIFGKKTFQIAQDEGRQQNLEALNAILAAGKNIYDFQNP